MEEKNKKQNEYSLDEELLQEIAEANQRSLEAEDNAIREFINLGTLLNKLKNDFDKKSKGEKQKWEDYLKEKAHIHIRRAQRAMRLARSIDLEKFPALAYISQSQLSRLVSLSKKRSVAETLKNGEIDCNIQPENQDCIAYFEKEIDNLIVDLMGQKTDGPERVLKSLGRFQKRVRKIIDDESIRSQFDKAKVEEIEQALTDILDRFRKMRNGTG